MRARNTQDGVSAHAVAGTEVVLLGLNASEEAAEGLLGFRVERARGKRGRFRSICSERSFVGGGSAEIVQAFQWSDYAAEPGETYRYRITPVRGTPRSLVDGKPVIVEVRTEDPNEGHGIYFNRGAAGSQAYSRRFGEHRRYYLDGEDRRGRLRTRALIKPEDVGSEAYEWLSRGLEEALLRFIKQAKGKHYALRAALYELTYLPAVQAFVDALETGADVKIIHHAKRESLLRLKLKRKEGYRTVTTRPGHKDAVYKDRFVHKEMRPDSVGRQAKEAVAQVGVAQPEHAEALDQMMIERTKSSISHNKFIVLLKDRKPIQVWTGSTNLTAGGIFGQLNVGHVIRNEKVAKSYYDYWKKLSEDPKKKSTKKDPPLDGIRNWTVSRQPDLKGLPPRGVTAVFSPRLGVGMLDWYAGRMAAAKSSIFITFAFTVADQLFAEITSERSAPAGSPFLRYVLLEGRSGLLRDKVPAMLGVDQNRVAWGDVLRRRTDDDEYAQFIETLTGLNNHVSYLHTKFMLIDPLSEDPIVISGSANFSEASTTANDENMLVIRGNKRVADIFLGEFMRLYRHFRYRNEVNVLTDRAAKRRELLTPDDSWTYKYYDSGSAFAAERELFS